MDRATVIQKTVDFVKETLAHAEAGHDWWHVYRVWRLAGQIALREEADLFVVELGALLHDIADSKFHNGDESIGPRMAREFLGSLGIEQEVISHVEKIIAHISFKGAAHSQEFRSAALDVVQDADRLDALGAIGIARAFNYGGYKGRTIYDPGIPPVQGMTKEAYKKNTAPTINHFYEKLLLLKDRMNTQTGREMATKRHRFMERFLEQFYAEWEGTE
jgi:uncharacterized protein